MQLRCSTRGVLRSHRCAVIGGTARIETAVRSAVIPRRLPVVPRWRASRCCRYRTVITTSPPTRTAVRPSGSQPAIRDRFQDFDIPCALVFPFRQPSSWNVAIGPRAAWLPATRESARCGPFLRRRYGRRRTAVSAVDTCVVARATNACGTNSRVSFAVG